MKHNIQVNDLGPLGDLMANTVTQCIHCGFCLPACPTFSVLGEEMDSPRGRIILMKSVLEGTVGIDDAMPYIDRCLGCLGCSTACPSGVAYGDLITPFRSYAEKQRRRPVINRISRRLTKETLPYPDRFRMAAKLGNLVKPASNLLPNQFHAMLDLLPSELPSSPTLPSIYPAEGTRRARVALLTGCVQKTLSPEINWATLRVLAKNGVEVIIPQGQGCCGALALHTGDLETARNFAQNNLRHFLDDFDAVITNAAGCGSTLHEYPMLFRGTEWQDDADEFSKIVQDISVFLMNLGLIEIPPLSKPVKIAYHDACHLAHAQHITVEPRDLLKQIPNLTLIEIPEGDFCCGSAGSYNIEQPEIAAKLGERKVRNVISTGADAVATGNIGCLIQLKVQLGLAAQEKNNGDKPIPVWHTLELLDQAYHPTI